MDNIRVVHNLTEEDWRQFLIEAPGSNIFHTPEMFDVFAQAKGHTPELWAVVDGRDKVNALFLPVVITLRNGLLRRLTTRSVVYGDFIYLNGAEKNDCIKALVKEYINHTKISLFTEIRHQSVSPQLRYVLHELNFKYEDHIDYLVDLALPVEKVWENIGKSTRKNIQKALKDGDLVIEEINQLEMLKTWYEIMKKSFARNGVPLADYSLFKAAFEILYPKGMVQFLIGKVSGQYIAASVAFLYKELIYGWYRGFDRAYAKFIPNDLMVWHLLKWGAEHGFKYFDFGGAGNPHKEYGPRGFKQKFGGQLVDYGRSMFIHAPLILKISEFGYELFHTFL